MTLLLDTLAPAVLQLLNGWYEQADQDRDDGDDHEARRAVIHEVTGVRDYCSVAELDRIAPREMNVTGAESIVFSFRGPHHQPNQEIAIGGLEDDDPVTVQRSFFLARKKSDFSVGPEPPQVRRRPGERKRRHVVSRKIDRSFPVLQLDWRFGKHDARRGPH